MRAFSTLEGVGKGLDPQFNFMEVAQPFALQIMANMSGNNGNSLLDELGRQAVQVGSTALGLPRRLEDTIEKLDRGDIRLRVRSLEAERLLRRLSAMQQGNNYTILSGSFLICATILFVNGYATMALVAVLVALLPALALFRLLRQLDRLDRMF
jgi:predicted unusual protein kinase regulating ubiquinone biosynthesis (AarF/ABC1/UbiB family)